MAAILLDGHTSWEMNRTEEGHREYTIVHRVRALSGDGPAIVATTPGLPLIGSLWLVDNDVDLWAFCWPNMRVRPDKTEQPNTTWTVEQLFSTKPLRRCQDTEIEDPLLEPQAIRGSTIKENTLEGVPLEDRNGDVIQSISFEPIEGLSFDASRPQVTIGQNVGTLELGLITSMIDTVNDDVLWGLPARKIKLSDISWSRKVFGTCGFYYTRAFTFEIKNTELGFDEKWREKGSKLLRKDGTLTEPDDWEIATDLKGDIDGEKLITPAGGRAAGDGDEGIRDIEYYSESNFLLLGIPTVIGL